MATSSLDSLDRYRASLHGTEPLDPSEERALAARYRAGDNAAGDRLIKASLPFVITVALEYRRWGAPLEDLVQQGNLGLLKAAKKFDPDRDCRLITYAVYWIRAEIRDYVVRAYRVVRIGGSKGERRTLRAFRRTREEDPAKLAAIAGVSTESVERILPVLKQRDVSLDAAPDGDAPAIDRLRDDTASPEQQALEHAEDQHTRGRIDEAMANLSQRERWILEHRMFGETEATLESLGRELGISKERVRQIEARALQKLRGALSDLAA